ncbi:MmpS family transport accessory protein [Leifsonia sp. fls2-241-R2A-40a]|uniref:MmpS family transport accessory protein n=1 Tax=Leifsonia sp. fls2-241-R2A-40a TaxID=3040290 RepID=UPI003305A4E1
MVVRLPRLVATATLLLAVLTGCSTAPSQVGPSVSTDGATTEAGESASPASDPSVVVTIKYDVTGTGASPSITYTTYSSGQGEVLSDLALPWTKTIATQQGGVGDPGLFTVVAVSSADSPSISCTITVNNEVKDSRTATGAGASVTCKWQSPAAK